jgi:hypothetical protein
MLCRYMAYHRNMYIYDQFMISKEKRGVDFGCGSQIDGHDL